MSLKKNIENDIKKAMLAKEKDTLRALRSVKSMILLAETEKGAGGNLSEEAEVKLLTKAAKQRKESAEMYASQGRKDLEEIENDELKVIEKYLPAQLSEEEIKEKVTQIIQKIGATSPADTGKVIGAAVKELAGKADGKAVADAVKELLSN